MRQRHGAARGHRQSPIEVCIPPVACIGTATPRPHPRSVGRAHRGVLGLPLQGTQHAHRGREEQSPHARLRSRYHCGQQGRSPPLVQAHTADARGGAHQVHPADMGGQRPMDSHLVRAR